MQPTVSVPEDRENTGLRQVSRASCRRLLTLGVVFISVCPVAAEAATGGDPAGPGIGASLTLWTCIPFAGILLSIALFPLVAPHFWHRHYPKVSFAWAVGFAVPFLLSHGHAAVHEILHIYLLDYLPFIILLWGLFTVAGGIVVRGTLAGKPGVNTSIIAIGTAIASLVGTTGAAMLLIRPILRANAGRRHKIHVVVFFIFLVANIGGSLTPLGDPPLFLGFLHGVPFFWTLKLAPHWGLASGLLLGLFFVVDTVLYRRERQDGAPPESPVAANESIRIDGLYNLLFLAGIMGAVLMSGLLRLGEIDFFGVQLAVQSMARDSLILVMGALSLYFTPRALRRDNEFTWEPIREVAVLFAGIFMTIIPALAILKAGEDGAFGFLVRSVQDPWQYFWVTGGLSSFLDNAPTYLTFFNSQLGRFYPGMPEAEAVSLLIREHDLYLEAIAVAAVFMGANTYIGNAPNFMVKSIAEEAGVAMPSFFGYMIRWSVPILVPIFVLVTLVFFL